ncbi:adhesion G protein-coupled receptor E1-like [Macrobrachium nipponense]|uniref:adhesion G protein-coupled receptor E1-like n=1 Tax=Macrobrachium nipponense TaxID=159736 RepID=UPI0030C8287E
MKTILSLLFIGCIAFAAKNSAESEDGEHANASCKPKKECADYKGFCVRDSDPTACSKGLLFPSLCTSDHCSCCLGDSCSNATCPANSTCVNTLRGYECTCVKGYKKVNGTCEDIDECSQPSACLPGQRCTNTPGSFECSCRSGEQVMCVKRCPLKTNYYPAYGCVTKISGPMTLQDARTRCAFEYGSLLVVNDTAMLNDTGLFGNLPMKAWVEVTLPGWNSSSCLSSPAISDSTFGPTAYNISRTACTTRLDTAFCSVVPNWL